MKNSGKQDNKVGSRRSETKGKLGNEIDDLFRLSLPEFIGARNTLAAQLKKSGRSDEALLVKALVKPSISAWAVNQLYWNHRDAFDRLIASGERFHKAQTSPHAGKLANLRIALDARREALTHLSDLATSLLRDAGHNPALDTTRRINATLEAISAMSAMSNWASRSDAPRPGRLTHDVDPPGFDSLASFIPGARATQPTAQPARLDLKGASPKSSSAPKSTRRKPAPDTHVRQHEEPRKAKIVAAKVSLQEAKQSLTEARGRAKSLEVTQKKVSAEAKKAEKLRRDAEESLEEARAVAEDAARRAHSVAVDLEEAATAVEDAQSTVESASKELESLLRESSRR